MEATEKIERAINASRANAPGHAAPPAVRVGSWPGPHFYYNSSIPTLCEALQRRGASIIDVEQPWRIRADEIDIFHIHWPEQIFWDRASATEKLRRMVLAIAALTRLRLAGVQILWMVHNVRPNDAGPVERSLWPFYVAALKLLTTRYMTLSAGTVPIVRQQLDLSPGSIVEHVRHPCYPRGGARRVARQRLGIAGHLNVYLFFGTIRPYKGVETLLNAFRLLKNPDALLIVAGEPKSAELHASLTAAARLDKRVALRLDYIEESELVDLISASDRVVLPFVDYLHSGSLVRALSQGRVTITPETAFSRTLHAELGDGWLRLYQGKLTAEHLALMAEPGGAPAMGEFSPDKVAEQIVRCYRAMLQR
jgi:glycosyltransferase involved in cell wall biosynthesis